MNNAGVTLEGNGITKAQAALDQARTECETGFQRRHSGEGSGDCRVVAVGAVPAAFGGNYIYNGSGWASPTGTGGWYDNWNKYVAPNTYKYAGTQNYHTSDVFSDDPSNSVDAIMRRNVEVSSKPSIVVIVLDKYQPAPPSYHLGISTQAAEMSGQSGDTKDASDVITLSSDGSKTENVNGTATLHWRGIDGTAEALARLGHTVTVRDADPSGAATLWAHKALSAGRPLPFGVEVVSRFTVAAPAEEESWRSTSR